MKTKYQEYRASLELDQSSALQQLSIELAEQMIELGLDFTYSIPNRNDSGEVDEVMIKVHSQNPVTMSIRDYGDAVFSWQSTLWESQFATKIADMIIRRTFDTDLSIPVSMHDDLNGFRLEAFYSVVGSLENREYASTLMYVLICFLQDVNTIERNVREKAK